MEYRKTELLEVSEVMKIIDSAKEYLKKQGLDQWQDGYPNDMVIENDVKAGISYVWVENSEIFGTTALSFDGEVTYEEIHEGNWKSNQKYGVIHRMAVSEKAKGSGVAVQMMNDAEKICTQNKVYSIKVDTHENNKPMQRLLEKLGYEYCGIIYLENGDKRVAFEKLLK